MKKIIVFLAVAACMASGAFASGKHHNKVRKGEVAAGIAAGVASVLFGVPEPPPPPPPPVVVQQPVVAQPVVTTPVVTPAPVVVPPPPVVRPGRPLPPPPPPRRHPYRRW